MFSAHADHDVTETNALRNELVNIFPGSQTKEKDFSLSRSAVYTCGTGKFRVATSTVALIVAGSFYQDLYPLQHIRIRVVEK